jgi:hypothetical protein
MVRRQNAWETCIGQAATIERKRQASSRTAIGLGGRATNRPHPAHLDCYKEVALSSTQRYSIICRSVPDSGHAGMTARRLATILDVVGYSRLVSADEADERLTARPCPHVWYWHQPDARTDSENVRLSVDRKSSAHPQNDVIDPISDFSLIVIMRLTVSRSLHQTSWVQTDPCLSEFKTVRKGRN